MADKEWTLPAYLTNLNSGLDDILLDGKDYLQGLPLRRRSFKRKRPNDNDVVSQPQATSLFHKITIYATPSQFRFGEIIYSRDAAIILSAVIVAASSVLVYGLIIRRRRFIDGSKVSKENTRRKKKRKRKKKKTKARTTGLTECVQTTQNNDLESVMEQETSCTKTDEDHSNASQLKEVAIVTPSKHKHETTKRPEIDKITTLSPCDNSSTGMNQETSITATQSGNQNEMDAIHLNHHQLNSQANFPITKIASRWESLGLSRQKSLELAANAELNWYFYQEIKHFVSSTAIHLFSVMCL